MNQIELYIQAWNATDLDKRTSYRQECFAEHGTYVDSHVPQPLISRQAMVDMIAMFRSRLNHQLVMLGQPDLHHQVFRFRWKLENEQGVLSTGTFVGSLDGNGKIKQVIGFLDA